eukprot:TRINITY_DN1035_c0_g1_i1.p1 TRINITY_DN1035_c0_g1~~TRINITY_DN1035_c0_g1_i1.p1  ORF type:complete len:214 (+),score=52.48 TRINITY_DN1035_c0_g1_i1:752-1393(+)
MYKCIASLIPMLYSPVRLFWEIHRSHPFGDTHVVAYGDHVMKRTYFFERHDDIDRDELVKVVNGSDHCVHVEHLKQKRNSLSVRVSPVGTDVRDGINSSKDMKNCLVCILSALDHLHRNGWVHRDPRPANIIATYDSRVPFLLMDFEHSAPSGLELPMLSKPETVHTPKIDLEMAISGVLDGRYSEPFVEFGGREWESAAKALEYLGGMTFCP